MTIERVSRPQRTHHLSKLIPLMAESQLHAVANPLSNVTLQGRHDTHSKHPGMTRVPKLLAAGINVGFGHDCAMNPWYPQGSADMLEVAQMGLHVAQMTSMECMRAWKFNGPFEISYAPTRAMRSASTSDAVPGFRTVR